MSPIRVLIVDDHPVVRSGIRKLLAKDPNLDVVGEAGDGDGALDLIRSLSPDVLLLDMEMPGKKGYEVIQQLKEEGLQPCILVLSAHVDKYYIQQLRETGVSGYLIKDEAPANILDAIHGVASGEMGWVSRQVSAELVDILLEEDGSHDKHLTVRELEVLEGLTYAKTNGEIAVLLGISDKTVEKHMESIFRKLEVTSRVEAAVHAIRSGLFK